VLRALQQRRRRFYRHDRSSARLALGAAWLGSLLAAVLV
jgi:hypothetical protein